MENEPFYRWFTYETHVLPWYTMVMWVYRCSIWNRFSKPSRGFRFGPKIQTVSVPWSIKPKPPPSNGGFLVCCLTMMYRVWLTINSAADAIICYDGQQHTKPACRGDWGVLAAVLPAVFLLRLLENPIYLFLDITRIAWWRINRWYTTIFSLDKHHIWT